MTVAGVVAPPETPAVNAELAVVGETAGASFTVRVKVCVAAVPTPLFASRFSVIVPPEPAVGVPRRTPLVRVSQLGSVLEVLKLGAGKPLAVSVKEPWLPTAKVVDAALVKAGASPTVSVKIWVALVPTPLAATMFSV